MNVNAPVKQSDSSEAKQSKAKQSLQICLVTIGDRSKALLVIVQLVVPLIHILLLLLQPSTLTYSLFPFPHNGSFGELDNLD